MFSSGEIFTAPGVDMSGTSQSGRSLHASNIAPTQWAPNIHYVQPINNQWWVGASATTNYGLATEFNNDYAGKTDLQTVNINLSTAYRLNQHFSFGVGVDAVYARAKIAGHAGESSAALGMPRDTQIAHLKGNGWGYGWNAGTSYFDNDNWTFRSGIAFDDSPVPVENRSISIPDQDRLWLSAGAAYAFNQDASVDVGVSWMHGQHVTIREGNYTFNSTSKAWLYGTNFNYRF